MSFREKHFMTRLPTVNLKLTLTLFLLLSGWSRAEPPSIQPLPPAPSTLFRPLELEVITSPISQASFSWNPVDGASAYFLEIAASPHFLKVVHSQLCREPEAAITLLGGGTWYWRVAALDKQGLLGPSCPSRTFLYLPPSLR